MSVNFESKLWSREFFQKTNKLIRFYYYVFVRFLEEIEDTKKTFRNYLTLKIIWTWQQEMHKNRIPTFSFCVHNSILGICSLGYEDAARLYVTNDLS